MAVRIQVLISEKTAFGEFNDALYFSPEEYAALTEQQIAEAKKARVDAWVEAVSNPPEPLPPTVADVANKAASVRKDFEELAVTLADDPFATVVALAPLRAQVTAVAAALQAADGS